MTVTFTTAELQEITQWYNEGPAAGNYSIMYLGIASLLEEKLQGASPADEVILNQDILWLEGASQANSGQRIYSTLIRTYTEIQADLRLGSDISSGVLQQASNQVAPNLYSTIQSLNGGIPNLTIIC